MSDTYLEARKIMKKILSIGLLTVCAMAISERQASAWVNAKFSVGLNWHLQSANNNVLWGFYKNGQVPGPEAFGGGGPGGPMPFNTNPPANSFPFFGNGQGYPQGMPQGYPETAPPQAAAQQQAFYGQNPYQSVSYQPNSYYPNYYYPSYYYPTYNQGYSYQAPYYWNQGR